MIIDKFYTDLINGCGTITCGLVNHENGSTNVAIWDGINPIIVSQRLIEAWDYDLPDIERLPNRAIRICQYRFDFHNVYPKYGVVLFNVTELPTTELYTQILNDWNKYNEQ